MNANSLQSVVIAGLLIAALGVSATTLEASLSTDPDDVINIDPGWLPIWGDSLVDAKDEMESNADVDGGQPDESDGSSNTAPRAASDGNAEEDRSVAGQGVERAAARVDDGLGNDRDSGPGLLERLLDLLRRLLLALLALAALIALLALGYRYADRIRALLARDRHRDSDLPWPPAEPEEDVERAWLTMVARLEAERPRSRTPAEWASVAVESGMDPEAVDELTRTFAEVRYGGEQPTPSRRQRAWSYLERIRTTFDGRSR